MQGAEFIISFSIPRLLLTSEIYSALLQFEIFSAFTLQGIASSRLLPIIYWSDEFLNRVSRASIFKHRPEHRHS